MNRYKFFDSLKFLLLYFLCLARFSSHASVSEDSNLFPKKINFQHVLEGSDVVLGEVRSIFQDSEGFIWLGGSAALARYDGHTVREIQLVRDVNNKDKKEWVKQARSFVEAGKYIWLSMFKGVAVYDRELDELTPIEDLPNEPVISTSEIYDLELLSSGEIIASTGNGLFFIDGNTRKYRLLVASGADEQNKNFPSDGAILDLYRNKFDGLVWLGTKGGLNSYNEATGIFKHYPLPPEMAKSNEAWNTLITSITSTEAGSIWFGTRKHGLYHYSLSNGTFKQYVNDPGDPNSLGSNDIWDLMTDSKGRIWVSTDKGGLNLFNPKTENFVSHKHKASQPTSLDSDIVRATYEDNSGDIWVGLYPEGVDFFDASSTAISIYKKDIADPKSISYTAISSIAEDSDGNLWVGTDGGGVNYFDRRSEEFTHYVNSPDDPSSISSNAVLATMIDSKGHIWLGTWAGGVNRFDPTTKKFTRLPFATLTDKPLETKALTSPHVWSITEDSENYLWIGTLGGGLARYDRKSQAFQIYWHSPDKNSVSNDWIWHTFEDSKGNFWVVTRTGVDLLNRETGEFKNFLHDPNDNSSLSSKPFTIFEDSQGRLWVGADKSLELFDPEKGTFSHITREDGLFNASVRSILEDKNGVLWLSTASGVSTFDPDTKAIKNYNRDSGKLIGKMFFNAGLLSKNNEIVLGGTNGLRIYRPDELKDNMTIPPIAITGFSIWSDPVIIGGEDGVLTKSINFTDSITLNHRQSMFTFEFAALNFRESEKNRYSYKLDGFDEEWVNISADRKAKYTSLDAGTYTFRVKGSNNDGIWNEKGRSIKVHILPPPWQTWWAYAIYSGLILALLFAFVHSQHRKRQRIEEQNRLLEQKVSERTAELRKKNEDIQSMLSNMQQGLLTIEGEGIISAEYSDFLESIYETKEVAGQNAVDFLFNASNLGADLVSQIREAVSVMANMDETTYLFNQHILPTEFKLSVGGDSKIISLDWHPITVNNIILKLMVTVRDITRLREVEQQALDKAKELEIIGQLLKISGNKYRDLMQQIKRLVDENRKCIIENSVANEQLIAALFRNMHTLKGNCRTYSLKYLCDVIHVAESSYSEIRSSKNYDWNQESLQRDLDQVELALDEYDAIYKEVFFNRGVVIESTDKHLVDEAEISGIRNHLAQMKAYPNNPFPTSISAIEDILDTIESSTFKEAIKDIIDSVSSIADDLGKPSPNIMIDEHEIKIKKSNRELLTNVFSHLIRNAIDHGIEPPEERLQCGKDKAGNINLVLSKDEENIYIRLTDDGRGINLEKLLEKAKSLGIAKDDKSLDDNQIAELVFESGLSTKNNVTDISGRGVGMDAVKAFLAAEQGDIKLNVLERNAQNRQFARFETLVTLPLKDCG